MIRILLTTITLMLTALLPAKAAEEAANDSTDQQKLGTVRRVVRGFDRLNEQYIEPQHYVFTAMMQVTYTYDMYRLIGNEQDVTLAPDGSLKVGPYFGWKWVFAGYTFSLGHSDFSKTKTELGLSIYSSQVGVDLLYRRTGSDYKLRNIRLGGNIDTRALEDISFDGVKAGITGLNVYYVFNHGRFSYPAAFAQSTCQKISCGSWLAGVGYMKNTLEVDYDRLHRMVSERLGVGSLPVDSSLMFNSLEYNDFNISGGYAYNWVFAKDWLFCACGQLALGYKRSKSDARNADYLFRLENVAPNMVGRFALVYNNMRWYAGLSAFVHSNNYHKSSFSTNNTFGSMNMYVGYNFGLKKKYRKK